MEANGCELPIVNGHRFVLAPFEFDRCPVLSLDAEHELAVELHQAKVLARTSPVERQHLPARLVEALIVLEQMKGGEDAD